MIALQTAMGVQALALGVLTVTGAVRVWEIAVLAVILGMNNAFESPARQSFMLEMVGAEHLRNAVSLNSVLDERGSVRRPRGRRVVDRERRRGGVFLDQRRELRGRDRLRSRGSTSRLCIRTPPAPRAPGQLREGLRYVRSTPELAIPLLMMAVVGCLTYEFQVSLPVMAKSGLHVGAAGFGFMTASMGIGAVLGGLLTATRGRIGLRPLVTAAGGFGIAVGLAALAPSLSLELAALAVAGAASITFMATANSTLQLRAKPSRCGGA